MNHNSRLTGPAFLEELAARQEANGFTIEAEMLRERAKEWSRDKQTIENGMPFDPRVEGCKSFNASLIEADIETNRLVLRPDAGGPRRTSGRYHLIPIAAAG